MPQTCAVPLLKELLGMANTYNLEVQIGALASQDPSSHRHFTVVSPVFFLLLLSDCNIPPPPPPPPAC